MKRQAFRNLAIDLLDDAQGINTTGWKTLAEMLNDEGYEDIVEAVKTHKGRVHLPSEAAAELRLMEGEDTADIEGVDDEDEDEAELPEEDEEDDE